jgi:hypothetical protein
VLASVPASHRLSAHPVEWAWTNPHMRQWFAEHAP